jgi:NAD-dependent SIR2 family protein deacetylase
VQSGARLAIVNLSETPLDSKAAVVVRGKAGETLPLIVGKVKAGL